MIKLEGGTDFDLTILDYPDEEDKRLDDRDRDREEERGKKRKREKSRDKVSIEKLSLQLLLRCIFKNESMFE